MKIKKYDILRVIKKEVFFLSLIVMIGCFFSGCWDSSTKKEKLVIVNVLDKENYDDCHITGSIHIPFEDLETRIKTLNKKDHYVFYCSNYACSAAPFSVKMLKNNGFEHVFLYPGGIVDWYQKKYPYQGPAKLEYLQDKNEPLDEEDNDIITLSAEELKAKMEQFGLLK